MRIAHIINPVNVSPASSLYFAQPVTFETMRRARDHAFGLVDITLLTAQYAEDRSVIPLDFYPTPDLTRSILDLGVFQNPRKLPLLGDILNRAYEHSAAEYLIYTNVDIGLQPHFYTRVAELISVGYNAFTINRRTIKDCYTSLEQIDEMCADPGEPHRGWDCFVFPRASFPQYNLGNVCIGIPRADLVLLANIQAFSENFQEFRHEHLTFHIGNDRSWWNSAYSDYATHNSNEAVRILSDLEQNMGGSPPGSPPATFLYFARNRLRWYLYETILRYFHIPARFGRPLRSIIALLTLRRKA